MNKTIVATAILVAFAAVSPLHTMAKKDKKQKQTTEQPAPLVLQSSVDTLSYAGGISATKGFMPYLVDQMKVDTAYMADFIRGYEEAMKRVYDPAYMAYISVQDIAKTVQNNFIPRMNEDFDGTPDAIIDSIYHEGFLAGVKGDTTVFTMTTADIYFKLRSNRAKRAKEEAYKKENEDWLAQNATQDGVKTTASGLQYKILTAGSGDIPTASDEVEVIYEGKTIDGTIFDTTANHKGKKSDNFRCNQVIKGWTEALTMMPVGSKWEIYIPQELGYGSRTAGKIKPYSTLIFTVELVSIKAAEVKETATENANAKTNGTTAKTKKTAAGNKK